MFPLVPYHAVPRLHELMKDDCPPAYSSLWSCWKEIVPTLERQCREPAYHVERVLPESAGTDVQRTRRAGKLVNEEGWIDVCDGEELQSMDVLRYDHEERTYAIYRGSEGELYATDGICTHGKTHLADGLIVGKMIECPKHNGRFNLEDGSPARKPVCKALKTHEVKECDGRVFFRIGERLVKN